jgi:hypothetical protein
MSKECPLIFLDPKDVRMYKGKTYIRGELEYPQENKVEEKLERSKRPYNRKIVKAENHRDYWTDEKVSELIAFIKNEMPTKKIAKELGRTVDAIRAKMHKDKLFYPRTLKRLENKKSETEVKNVSPDALSQLRYSLGVKKTT